MLRTLRLQLARWIAPAEEKPGSAAMALPHLRNGESTASAAKALDGAVNISPYHAPKAYDDTLYERARTQWQFGDWESLICIGRGAIESHPERGRLALMVAAAHLQCNNSMAAKQYIRLAQEWGCSKKLIGQILVAGVHNSLGRVAHIKGDEAKSLQHFEQSLGVGSPGSAVKLLGQARMQLQVEQMDFSQMANKVSGKIGADEPGSNDISPVKPASPTQQESNFAEDAYTFYRQLSVPKAAAPDSALFILLDSKSLPRSGLHYLKNTLSKVLGECFSFCEWYQEPGCCRKMPCIDTSYAQYALKNKVPRIRLLKSHDFDLRDPVYPVAEAIRRTILVRDPVFQLTSWFALDELGKYKAELANAGIKLQKIWLTHEPEVIAQAYDIVDSVYVPPSRDTLESWLSKKSQYVEGFLKKWALTSQGEPDVPGVVVAYENIDSYMRSFFMEIYDHMPVPIRENIEEFVAAEGASFSKRTNPYQVRSEKISAFMQENSAAFLKQSEQLLPLFQGLQSAQNPEISLEANSASR